MVRHADGVAEEFCTFRIESGESGVEGCGGEGEADGGSFLQAGEHMQKQHAVLAAGDSDEDGISVPNHAIIADGGSGKFVDFVQNIHENLRFWRKDTRKCRKINEERLRNEKKICVS